ncbi:MAG: serine hydrolase domain-containing protein [Candidatus Thorarchaeota archaeon]
MRVFKIIIIIFLFGVLMISEATSTNIRFAATESEFPLDEWTISSPEDENMSSEHLQDMLEYINENMLSINSIVIVRHGRIVLEQYYDFFDENTSMNIFSCTKTVTSMLVGIAIDQGYISNTSVPILPYFADRDIQNMDDWKQAITLEDLLTMRAGFDWDDNSDAGMSEYNQMLRSADWVQFVLDRPMSYAPGTVFNYNSGASLLLSAIIQNATGMTADEFAGIHLFEPLGISEYHWRENSQGITIGGNTLTLRPRDMAKLGLLLLHNGTWGTNQIISSGYVREATMTHTIAFYGLGYGYQIWTHDSIGVYQAMGYAGQYIFVAPEYDLVTVFTATSGWSNTAMEDWIIPSILEFTVNTNQVDILLVGIILTATIPTILALVYYFRIRGRSVS